MQLITTISLPELKVMAKSLYGNMVKGVVDLSTHQVVLNPEMHSQAAQYLTERGSQMSNLWGFSLHPEYIRTPRFIKFESMINIRPAQGNHSRLIADPEIKQQISEIVAKIII